MGFNKNSMWMNKKNVINNYAASVNLKMRRIRYRESGPFMFTKETDSASLLKFLKRIGLR